MKNMNRNELRDLFKEIGNTIPCQASMLLCGGASIILSTNHRESTQDVDYLYADDIVVSTAMDICRKKGLDAKLLNDDVKVTGSYSARLHLYKVIYLQFGNLTVYVLQDIALLCMKLKSFRSDSSDYEDCLFLIEQCKRKGISIDDVYATLNDIYPGNSMLSVDADRLLRDKFGSDNYQLDIDSLDSYVDMLDNKLITEDELPNEYKDQIIRYRNKSKTDNLMMKAIRSLNS